MRHAVNMLIVLTCLTLGLDSAPIRSESPKDRARRVESSVVGETTILSYPQFRKSVDNSKELSIRAKAKLWITNRGHLEDWKYIDYIIHKESRWIPNLWNQQGSTAYGLGQLKNSYKWTKNKPMKQFVKAIKYMLYRYDTFERAYKHHKAKGWY